MRGCFAGTAFSMLLLLTHALATDEPKTAAASADALTPAAPSAIPRPADSRLPNTQVANPQSQAEALLERARRLSDIRGPNAPSFRLKATFSLVGNELEIFEGTYTEFWVSDSKWRKEVVIGDRKKIEIAGDNKLWEIESGPLLPEKAARVEFAADVFPARAVQFEFESVDSVPGQRGVRCAITKPAESSSNAKSALCVERATGALVEYRVPQWGRYHLTEFACSYGEFQRFGSQWFPYAMTCRQGGHWQTEVHVTELTTQNFNDAKLFVPPAGATELGRCMAGEVAAKPDYTPAPVLPAGLRERVSPVPMRLVVDAKGEPEDIQVVRPSNKSLDEMAVGTVGRWRFKPATCNGEPMAQRIEFEVAFRSY